MCHEVQTLYDRLEIPEAEGPTSIGREEGEFICRFLSARPVRATLETGFAFGCSTAYILSASRAPHIAIDPYEHNYDNLGLCNLDRLGLHDRLELITMPAHLALPHLLTRGVTVDFAFVDGGHLFEEMFLDWYYITFLLNTGGHVMFHDRWLRATQLLASFIGKNRSDYREVGTPLENVYLFQKVEGPERDWRQPAVF